MNQLHLLGIADINLRFLSEQHAAWTGAPAKAELRAGDTADITKQGPRAELGAVQGLGGRGGKRWGRGEHH